MKSTNRFLHKAARLAKAKRIRGLTFTAADLGTFWHTHGARGTPTQFIAFLSRKGPASRRGPPSDQRPKDSEK